MGIRMTMFAVVALMLSACVVEERRPAHEPAAAPVHPTSAAPAAPNAHPAYLHALSDLRNARANVERKGGDAAMKWDEHVAIEHIDRAIAEIKQASIDDGKNLDEHPAVDAKEPRSGRLHKALAALKQARADIEHEEDNAGARGLRSRAVGQIDAAIHATDEGIADAAHGS